VPGKSLHLGVLEGDTQRIDVLKALASEPRLAILDYLGPQSVPLSQIAKKLGIPPSTAAMHVTALERAGLLRTDMTPASRGLQKMCARTYDEIVVTLPRDESRRGSRVEVSIAYPMLSIGYVVNAGLAWFLFGEAVGPQRLAGIAVIIVGVIIVARS